MQRPQKTAKVGCTCEGMVETKSNKGACSITALETERKDGAESLLERILDRDNLNRTYLKVKRNGGAAGIDQMTVEEMLPFLKEHREELLEKLYSGRYKPKAVRRGGDSKARRRKENAWSTNGHRPNASTGYSAGFAAYI